MRAREIIMYQVMRFADPADMEVGNWELCTDNILSALAAAGFKVVGREPTKEMVDAMQYKMSELPYFRNSGDFLFQVAWDHADPRGPGKETT